MSETHDTIAISKRMLKVSNCHKRDYTNVAVTTLHLGVLEKLDIIIIAIFTALKSANWQRVEQFVEPVDCRVVDVRVLTQELAQRRRVGGVVGVEVGRPVQHHQHDQTLLTFHRHVVVISHVELHHTERAETHGENIEKYHCTV